MPWSESEAGDFITGAEAFYDLRRWRRIEAIERPIKRLIERHYSGDPRASIREIGPETPAATQ